MSTKNTTENMHELKKFFLDSFPRVPRFSTFGKDKPIVLPNVRILWNYDDLYIEVILICL